MTPGIPTRYSPASTLAALPVSRDRLLKTLRIFEWLLLLIALAYSSGRTLPHSWRSLNTDFPNYYVAAHLLREGSNTDRIYEWTWIQQQKDHLGVEQPVVGFIPLTPLSALPIVPLTHFPPLQAKHIWIIFNVALLFVVIGLLHSITGLALHRIALLAALTFPIHRNFILGQMYVVLLAILTLALWLFLRNRFLSAGMFIGVAFGLKIFPAIFLLYFLRKRQWRSVAGFALGAGAMALLSIAIFGLELNRIYALQVLPWALRGEALDPYNLGANSISSVLHHMFIFEPEWNPHPLTNTPAVFAILHPLLQVLIFAPALLLSFPCHMEAGRTRLEWSVFTITLLAISTSPASYDFAILLLPAVVIASTLAANCRWYVLTTFFAFYLAVCYPFSNVASYNGWQTLLAVPRLYFVVMLCAFGYVLLYQGASRLVLRQNQLLWIAALTMGLITAITSNLWHQRGLYDAYRWRVPTSPYVFAASSPVADDNSILFTAMLRNGYHAGRLSSEGLHLSENPVNELIQTATTAKYWKEQAGSSSEITSTTPTDKASRLEINEAEFPVASSDGNWLAFQRSERGKTRLWLRSLKNNSERPITPVDLNVMEMSFTSGDAMVFSASVGGSPHLYICDQDGHVRLLLKEEARYPAVSPDGRWLAFCRLQHGIWKLWLRDLQTDKAQPITIAACNNITPSWEGDSKTLLYASDCGRGLWLTALCRRRLMP